MKRALLPLLAVALLFSCQKNESPVATKPPQTFDEAAFAKKIETISAEAVRKSALSHPGKRGPGKKFWRIVKIIGSDITGGITGALAGLQLTGNSTAGGITGGVAGAAAASLKAAEQYAVTSDASPNFKHNLKFSGTLQLNTHVPAGIIEINPFAYFGEFHNAQMVKLTPNIETSITGVTSPGGVPHHDSYNHGVLVEALTTDAYFGPYYNEVLEMGKPYTLIQYQRAAAFVDIFAYPTDADYLQGIIGKINTYIVARPLLNTSQQVYRLLFSTIEQLETIEEVEEYIYQVTEQVAFGLPDSNVDKEIMLQTLAVGAYSADFWYTINQ
jgi:hypothetical protein